MRANPYLIDAVIALSVVYKGFDNMGGFQRFFGFEPNTKLAVLIFGLFHGFGLATKLQELVLSESRAGHEHHQLQRGRGDRTGSGAFGRAHWAQLLADAGRIYEACVCANTALMTGGFILLSYQVAGYV